MFYFYQDAEPNDTYLLSRNSPYATSVEGDWMLSGELYEEGVLVSSSMQNGGNFVMHDFTFDASSDSPICSATKYAARPIGPGYQRSFSSWLDKSRTEKLLQNLPPETTSLKLRLNVVSPGLWSAEKPHVYTLVLALRNARENTIVQAESCRLGFRTIEISDGVLRVNQKPIMVRGVNYHEHDPVLGHSISSQLLEADMKLMKRHNFNAVRTSHYPQTAMFYELCTLYGLFVVDEANIETHGMKPYAGRLADSLEWELSFMRRLIRMIRCHRNHACIISWSLGNESGYGRTHDKMASLVRKYEPDRVLMYEPASYGPRESNTPSSWFGLGGGTDRHIKKLATDVLCPMYPRVEDCIIIANRNPDLPVVLCEYAHMMGNSGGNLDVYWKWFNNFSRLQGGFIWDWADQGVSAISLTDLPIWAYGGDFGESYNDGAFCLNGLNWPDRGLGDALTFSRNDCAEARYARLFSRPSASTFREIPDNETLEDRCTSNAIMGNLSYRGFSLPSKVETNFNINFPEYVEQERRKSFKFISGSDVSNMNPNGLTYLDDMKIDRHVYGLQRVVDIVDNSKSDSNSKSKSYVCATSPYRFTTSISIPVDDAVAKPQLLEAKQCMKVFDCEVTSLHPTVWDRHQGHINTADSSRSSGMNSSGNASTASVPNAGKDNMAIGESQSHYPLSITIHYSILNRLNHIKNIEEYLQFDVLLLCDGIIVDRKPMVKRNRHGATNRRHVFDPDDGMTPYMQEVEMLCHFSVSLTRWPVNAIGFEKLNCPPYTNNDKCATQSGENKEGPKIPPLLPLSRCASASIPTNNPSVAPSVYESPSEKIKKSFATEQFATLLRPSIGWTAYGHAWPEDALIATDSFDHLPFNIPKWSSDGEKDGSEIRPRGESTGSNEWIRGPQYIEHVTSIHEANINLQSKRSVNAMKQDYSKLEPSLWSDITPATKWSTVVIGRLVPDTPWAEAGFPLGFAQCNISGKLIYSLLPCTSTTSSKTQFGADSLPPKAPTSSIISSQQSELNPGFYDASNKSSKNLYFEQLVDSSLKSETLMAKDEDENEFGIENFINIDEDHAVKEEIRTNFDASAVKRCIFVKLIVKIINIVVQEWAITF